jgi:hypothetical protein
MPDRPPPRSPRRLAPQRLTTSSTLSSFTAAIVRSSTCQRSAAASERSAAAAFAGHERPPPRFSATADAHVRVAMTNNKAEAVLSRAWPLETVRNLHAPRTYCLQGHPVAVISRHFPMFTFGMLRMSLASSPHALATTPSLRVRELVPRSSLPPSRARRA